MNAIIDVRNATVYRGRTKVFDDLSLTISKGENTAILGPNGAGKSTFLRLLTKEIYPVKKPESWVRLFGRDRWEVVHLREQLGIVSHDLQANYRSTVRCREVVLSGFFSSIGIWPHQHYTDDDLGIALEKLQEMEVLHLAKRPFSTVSTGEQRRVLMARALVNNPATLVLDEPTSGLDLKACYQYLHLVSSLIEKGKTILLVTHHIHEIPPAVTRVILLEKGRILEQGPKEEMLTDSMLSRLYDVPLRVIESNGYYQVTPR